MADLFPQVRDLVAKQVGVRPETITPETTLFGDLGVDGLDGSDLFEAFAAEFHVDLTGLDLRRHFGPEGFGCNVILLPYFLIDDYFRPGDPHEKAGMIPIRVDDLVRSADAGRWVGPGSDDAATP